jgi:hypothetical protein
MVEHPDFCGMEQAVTIVPLTEYKQQLVEISMTMILVMNSVSLLQVVKLSQSEYKVHL